MVLYYSEWMVLYYSEWMVLYCSEWMVLYYSVNCFVLKCRETFLLFDVNYAIIVSYSTVYIRT